MNRLVEISKETSDTETRIYQFVLMDESIYLEKILVLKRETKRHKFLVQMQDSYGRIMQRDYGIKEEPDVDIEIVIEAMSEFKKRICFKRWRD